MDHTSTTENRLATPSRSAGPPRSPYVWCGLAAAAATLGYLLSVTSTPLPDAEQMTAEDAIDMVALLSFGVVGAELLRRGRAPGLGRALLLLAALQAVNYLLAGIGDALTDGETPTPEAARLCWMVADTAFIASFFLLLYAPLALFPTGRLPSRRWRWLSWVTATGIATMTLSIVLSPGPVDTDNPATGANPLGVDALVGLTEVLEDVAVVLLFLTLVGAVAAYVVRWFRYRGARRRQLAWLAAGAVVTIAGAVTDLGGSLVVEVVSALVIFGTLLGGMAWPLLGPLGAEAERTDETTAPRPRGG